MATKFFKSVRGFISYKWSKQRLRFNLYLYFAYKLSPSCLFVTEKTSKRSGLNFLWCLLCLCIIQSEVCTATEFLLAVCLGLGLSTLVHQGHQLLNPSAHLHLSVKKLKPCSHIFNLFFSGVFRFLKKLIKILSSIYLKWPS